MIVLDANVLVSSIAGRLVPRVVGALLARGVELGVCEPQALECARVLVRTFEYSNARAIEAVQIVLNDMRYIASAEYAGYESAARERLHARGQSDWPMLAAALALGAGIWSHDHDFFGVGVPVWSSKVLFAVA